MKKKLTAVLLAGLLAFSLVGTVLAADNPVVCSTSVPTSRSQTTSRAEQTEWRFRIIDGQKQKRLWSITEGKWLTDWMDVNL